MEAWRPRCPTSWSLATSPSSRATASGDSGRRTWPPGTVSDVPLDVLVTARSPWERFANRRIFPLFLLQAPALFPWRRPLASRSACRRPRRPSPSTGRGCCSSSRPSRPPASCSPWRASGPCATSRARCTVSYRPGPCPGGGTPAPSRRRFSMHPLSQVRHPTRRGYGRVVGRSAPVDGPLGAGRGLHGVAEGAERTTRPLPHHLQPAGHVSAGREDNAPHVADGLPTVRALAARSASRMCCLPYRRYSLFPGDTLSHARSHAPCTIGTSDSLVTTGAALAGQGCMIPLFNSAVWM